MAASSPTAVSPTAMPPLAPPTGPAPNPMFRRLGSEAQVRATVVALERNGFDVILAKDGPDAAQKVFDLLPAGSELFDATSQTLTALGLNERLADPARFHNIRPELMRLRAEGAADAQRKLGASPDVIVGSVHAITETGTVVVASATGSQLAPYAAGAKKVIWVVGTHKIVPDLATAFQRIEEYALPLEDERAQKAYGMRSTVAKLLVVHRELFPGRTQIVLVPEALGF